MPFHAALFRAALCASLVACASAAPALAQVRIAQWNITDWKSVSPAVRGADFQTSIYGINPANGLSMSPDLIILEEIVETSNSGQSNVNSFVALLNNASGSPGDWTSVPYVTNQGDTGNALVYRTSKFTVSGPTTVLGVFGADVGSGGTQSPRDNQRWQVRLAGYTGPGAELYLYGAHMKAGSTSTDQARREPEGARIRKDANSLPAGSNFILGGDFNVQSSSQVFYQSLVAYIPPTGSPNDTTNIISGQFFDPINAPGNWENQSSFRNIHTQEQGSMMDSRHDQLLISASLRDMQGLSYIPAVPGGNPLAQILTPFQGPGGSGSSAWNDPNHSYRCWGNDGNNYNVTISTNGNTQVGTTIADALIRTATQPTMVEGNVMGGHLPVYLDLQVPAKLGAPANNSTIDLGTVSLNSVVTYTLSITNAANVALYSKPGNGTGIDALTYTLTASGAISAPSGTFNRTATSAPAAANTHTITLNTATGGARSGTLTISSDDPDNPTRTINFIAQVGASQPPAGNYDVNNDGVINIEDMYRWYAAPTDVNGTGGITSADLIALQTYLRWFEMTDITFNRR